MSAPKDYDRANDNYRPPPAAYRNDRSERGARFYDDRSQNSSSRDRYRRTPSPRRRQASPHEMNIGASAVIDVGACLHLIPDDVAMWIETTKDTDHLPMIAEAEAEAEVGAPNEGIARPNSAPYLAERSFWKESQWTF
ncbi:MAG: hypothetical protein Q9169_004903 [Polycauliona sp. 2 TL-2023]